MRKTKVVLVTLSAARPEDGGRDTINETEICSCKDPHDARVILDSLRKIHYKEHNYSDGYTKIDHNEPIIFTSIKD